MAYSQKLHKALNLPVTEERYRALFYMSLHTFVHNLLNVLVQKNSMVWVRERTVPTERLPLVGKVIANFCG
jgi:hypothetical protein